MGISKANPTVVIPSKPLEVAINYEELAKCTLNDFFQFDRALFFEGERVDFKSTSFNKFYNREEDCIFLPFAKPKKLVEYQINHYVLWSVMSGAQLWMKPTYCTYNYWSNKIPLIRKAHHKCFACEYSKHKETYSCECCPIWDNTYENYICENGLNSEYRLWLEYCDLLMGGEDNSEEDDKFYFQEMSEYAWKLANIHWCKKIKYNRDY